MSNDKLELAKKRKKDEFYTRYEDIEKEVSHYKQYFKGKVVYTNCDDPLISNFYKFFKDNFKEYGLKRLICTYLGGNVFYYDGTTEITDLPLYGDCSGSYDCYQWFIDRCDVIVTNPPFSVFRDYYEKIHKKDFLIIGNQSVFKSEVIFRDIWSGRARLGYNAVKWYIAGEDMENVTKGEFVHIGAGVWLTSFPVERPFFKCADKEVVLEEYDNYYAVNVDSEKDIPASYDGVMGVPISFLQKLNTDQFELLGVSSKACGAHLAKDNVTKFEPWLHGKAKFARIFIKKLQKGFTN